MFCDGILVCRIGDSDNGVVLDNVDYVRFYEWLVVIVICGYLKVM